MATASFTDHHCDHVGSLRWQLATLHVAAAHAMQAASWPKLVTTALLSIELDYMQARLFFGWVGVGGAAHAWCVCVCVCIVYALAVITHVACGGRIEALR